MGQLDGLAMARAFACGLPLSKDSDCLQALQALQHSTSSGHIHRGNPLPGTRSPASRVYGVPRAASTGRYPGAGTIRVSRTMGMVW